MNKYRLIFSYCGAFTRLIINSSNNYVVVEETSIHDGRFVNGVSASVSYGLDFHLLVNSVDGHNSRRGRICQTHTAAGKQNVAKSLIQVPFLLYIAIKIL